MRSFLIGLIALQCAALVAGACLVVFGAADLERRAPDSPVFRPPIHEAVIGDWVRYQIRARNDANEVLGYIEYRVIDAREIQGQNLGRLFTIEMIKKDAAGKRTKRRMAVLPRSLDHGFLPPRINEDSYPPMWRPLVKTIRTDRVRIIGRERPAFLVEAVIPHDSLEEVQHRYWISDRVPVFGVARWERKRDVFVLHSMERPGR